MQIGQPRHFRLGSKPFNLALRCKSALQNTPYTRNIYHTTPSANSYSLLIEGLCELRTSRYTCYMPFNLMTNCNKKPRFDWRGHSLNKALPRKLEYSIKPTCWLFCLAQCQYCTCALLTSGSFPTAFETWLNGLLFVLDCLSSRPQVVPSSWKVGAVFYSWRNYLNPTHSN